MSGDGVGFFFLTATDQLEEQIGADSIDRQIIVSSMNLSRDSGLKSPVLGERGQF
jgi:hypothetical protein